jgi:hypothetical protein
MRFQNTVIRFHSRNLRFSKKGSHIFESPPVSKVGGRVLDPCILIRDRHRSILYRTVDDLSKSQLLIQKAFFLKAPGVDSIARRDHPRLFIYSNVLATSDSIVGSQLSRQQRK